MENKKRKCRETFLGSSKIIEFESNQKTFELWKKFTTEKIEQVEKKQKEKKALITALEKINHQHLHISECTNECTNECTTECTTECTSEFNKLNRDCIEEKANSYNEEIYLLNKKKNLTNYVSELEKYIECLNNNLATNLKESLNDTCIVTYENYLNRNVNLNSDCLKNQGAFFLNSFYSSVYLIKENKVIIPKGLYLYELIYPQTDNSFPVINKLQYYFVKLFLNNKWILIFVDFSLSGNKEKLYGTCFSANPKEIWPLIIQKALYTCFEELPILQPHLYITELLTGFKFIKRNYKEREINENANQNYIQCLLLSNKKEKESFITSSNSTSNEQNEVTNTLKKKDKRHIRKNKKKKKRKKRLSDKFLFLICSVEKEYLGIRCKNIQPTNSIIFEDSIFYKEKNKIPKGYKYVSNEGEIKIGNKQLAPISIPVPVNVPVDVPVNVPVDVHISSKEDYEKKKKDVKVYESTSDNAEKEENKPNTIIINENCLSVIQILKELITFEKSKKKKKYNNSSDKKVSFSFCIGSSNNNNSSSSSSSKI